MKRKLIAIAVLGMIACFTGCGNSSSSSSSKQSTSEATTEASTETEKTTETATEEKTTSAEKATEPSTESAASEDGKPGFHLYKHNRIACSGDGSGRWDIWPWPSVPPQAVPGTLPPRRYQARR